MTATIMPCPVAPRAYAEDALITPRPLRLLPENPDPKYSTVSNCAGVPTTGGRGGSSDGGDGGGGGGPTGGDGGGGGGPPPPPPLAQATNETVASETRRAARTWRPDAFGLASVREPAALSAASDIPAFPCGLRGFLPQTDADPLRRVGQGRTAPPTTRIQRAIARPRNRGIELSGVSTQSSGISWRSAGTTSACCWA